MPYIQQNQVTKDLFARRINYELKRAERYRIFVSLVVFNITPMLEYSNRIETSHPKVDFLTAVGEVLKKSVREIDAISNSGRERIGLLFPETSRQGAEAAARRISNALNIFFANYFGQPADYPVPVEISSFPDAAGARSLASYLDEFTE